jgi:hypothetical protein
MYPFGHWSHPFGGPMSRSYPTYRSVAPSLIVLAGLLAPAFMPLSSAQAADDDTCVGRGEYKRITLGMSIDKLGQVLHGQAPFAETVGKGRQRYRWYVACDAWQPDRDVSVRYRQPVVGRRTVTKKALDVYVAPVTAG